MASRSKVRTVRPPERDTLVSVCRKCSGDGKALHAALKREFKQRGRGKAVRVVKTSCLDICPKRAVAVAVATAGNWEREGGVCYFSVADGADPALVASNLRPDNPQAA